MSSPAAQAYAKRQSMRTLRRRDGTEDFRPLTGASMLKERDMSSAVHSPLRKAAAINSSESPSSRWLKNAGLPGFGDNEAHGKILPCHRVREDGLMRITSKTVSGIAPRQRAESWCPAMQETSVHGVRTGRTTSSEASSSRSYWRMRNLGLGRGSTFGVNQSVQGA